MIRNRYTRLISLLVLSLLASGQVFAHQAQEQADVTTDIIRTIHTLNTTISNLQSFQLNNIENTTPHTQVSTQSQEQADMTNQILQTLDSAISRLEKLKQSFGKHLQE